MKKSDQDEARRTLSPFFTKVIKVSPQTNTISADKEEELDLEQDFSLELETAPMPRKRLKKTSEKKSSKKPQYSIVDLKGAQQKFGKKYSLSSVNFDVLDDSDNEDESGNLEIKSIKPYPIEFPEFPESCIVVGLRAKFLANVYLKKIDATANIFLPRYIATYTNNQEKKDDYFRTPQKREICIFASGGLYNVWEKTVKNVFIAFFGARVKIIRAYWIQKHLYSDKGIRRDIEEEFKGKEEELHSEFYFDIFFKEFFLPQHKNLKDITIQAYSWWDVCNDCEKRLTDHKDLVGDNTRIIYNIVASRKYAHSYPPHSLIKNAYIPAERNLETNTWERIWNAVLRYARKTFNSEAEKERFWTRTKEGLEICKWLGQAFVENKVTIDGIKAEPLKKGDILKYYATANDDEVQELNQLLTYLREKNWDLSCWYKAPLYPDKIQGKWKNYWRQFVTPHFNWEVVYNNEQQNEADCEMCGYQGITNVYLVFHPKFRPSMAFFNLPSEDQSKAITSNERILPYQEVSSPVKEKRKRSLSVGSECVQVLCHTEADLDEWQTRHTTEEVDAKAEELIERQTNNKALEEAEREIERREYKRKFKR